MPTGALKPRCKQIDTNPPEFCLGGRLIPLFTSYEPFSCRRSELVVEKS